MQGRHAEVRSPHLSGRGMTSHLPKGQIKHSMCLECFRKRWPHGTYSSYQALKQMRTWEVCCFCLKKHKDGLSINREPRNKELKCGGTHLSGV
jgi:hypothetical protein